MLFVSPLINIDKLITAILGPGGSGLGTSLNRSLQSMARDIGRLAQARNRHDVRNLYPSEPLHLTF